MSESDSQGCQTESGPHDKSPTQLEIKAALKRNDRRFTLVECEANDSPAWESFRLVMYEGTKLGGIAACSKCMGVHKVTRQSGTSGILRHHNQCTAKHSNDSKQLTLFQSNLTLKPESQVTAAEKAKIKSSLVKFVIKGYHSFLSCENEGLYDVCQAVADVALRVGRRIDVRAEFPKRKAVKTQILREVDVVKLQIQDTMRASVLEESVAYTMDMTTDDLVKRSYLDLDPCAFKGGQKDTRDPGVICSIGEGLFRTKTDT